MSRIGKQPIPIPAGASVRVDGQRVTVKGPNGELVRTVHPDMRVALDGGHLMVTRPSDTQNHRALHGLTRALLANMVTGVTSGFERVLLIEGTGYKADTEGRKLVLSVGYSHPVPIEPLPGTSFEVQDRGKRVMIRGNDKEMVGQLAVNVRQVRPPEPYKGKGIRYADEVVRRKAGKAGKVGSKK
ncbi:MAG: 50S ribosomal protein L6 [Chloroflexi bacterium CFX6]|nr:50S ribosomal protein L6 [Chloroflexi bacterium CFX6]